MKLAVVGLDSADWTLLDRWLHHLPHIAAIRRGGVSGPLESCRPPVTIPAWKCYATGKNPGKLGIYWFAHPNFQRRQLDLNLPGDLPGSLWELLPRALVVNTPGTFPPRTIDGVMVSGFPCPDGEAFATPPWVLPRLQGYRVNTRVPPRHPDFPEEAMELMRLQLGTFERLAPRFRFGQVTVFHIDELHHLYGSDSVVLDAWRMIDEAIGRIMDLAENVVLVSDHGSGPMKEFVNVVPYLEEAGLVRLRRDWAKGPLRAVQGLARAVPKKWRARLRNRWILPRVADAIQMRLEPLHEWLPAASNQLRHRVDWTSPVFPMNQGLFFKNPDARGDGKAVEALRECVAKIPGVDRVWTREEIYAGPHVGLGPDVWAETQPGVELSARFGESWTRRPPQKGAGWIVNHRQKGIFAFYGQDIDGQSVESAKIYDMCPTILSFFGVPPPPDVDGRVLPVRRRSARPRSERGSPGRRAA